MILINLLPEEHRVRTRSPLRFLAAVSVSVAVNTSLLAFWAWTAFGVAAEVNAELAVIQDTVSGLEPQVAYHKELEAEAELFQSREQTLERVTENRISWTSELDVLIDVINEGGDDDRYLVWLDDLNVDLKENERTGVFGMMSANAHSGTANFANVANFLEDLETSDLRHSFGRPAPPTGSASMKDEGLMPSEIWNFPLEMGLRAPKDRTRR